MQFTVDTDLAIAGIVLGLVAIAMATPPLFQMLWGRPRLHLAVDDFTGPDGKMLLVTIKNLRVENGFLRKIGVEREIGNVAAYFDIQEQGTGKFLQKNISGLIHNAMTKESGILTEAHPAFTVGVQIIAHQQNIAVIIDARAQPTALLKTIPPGDYVAHVTIIRGGEVHTIAKNFKVGTLPHETFWL
jgi:hypothetical protein